MEDKLLNNLQKSYDKFKNIIVGVDFDSTIFPYHEDDDDVLCSKVRILLQKLQAKGMIVMCLYTVVNESSSIKYKKLITEKLYKIKVDYINESPLDSGYNRKPYFNILLDDKAGLPYTYEILNKFYENNK